MGRSLAQAKRPGPPNKGASKMTHPQKRACRSGSQGVCPVGTLYQMALYGAKPHVQVTTFCTETPLHPQDIAEHGLTAAPPDSYTGEVSASNSPDRAEHLPSTKPAH